MRHLSLEHRFVATFPEQLEPGLLYVSIEYATVSHLCCCGCGEEVSTPLSPTDWKITFDGKTVSLSPSVGSWTLPCRSHYIISQGRVKEAAPWSDEQIELGRHRERRAKERYYSRPATTKRAPSCEKVTKGERQGWLVGLCRWLRISKR